MILVQIFFKSQCLLLSNTPVQFPEYPLQFPIRSWPKDDDPSFIGACQDDGDDDSNVDNDDDELAQG